LILPISSARRAAMTVTNNDEIFRHSDEYSDKKNYEDAIAVGNIVKTYESVRDAIFDALMLGKIDKIDLAIIEARSGSPMPSNIEIAKQIGVDEKTIRRRMSNIISLMPEDLRAKMKQKSRTVLLL